jgi:hypothetical protein
MLEPQRGSHRLSHRGSFGGPMASLAERALDITKASIDMASVARSSAVPPIRQSAYYFLVALGPARDVGSRQRFALVSQSHRPSGYDLRGINFEGSGPPGQRWLACRGGLGASDQILGPSGFFLRQIFLADLIRSAPRALCTPFLGSSYPRARKNDAVAAMNKSLARNNRSQDRRQKRACR